MLLHISINTSHALIQLPNPAHIRQDASNGGIARRARITDIFHCYRIRKTTGALDHKVVIKHQHTNVITAEPVFSMRNGIDDTLLPREFRVFRHRLEFTGNKVQCCKITQLVTDTGSGTANEAQDRLIDREVFGNIHTQSREGLISCVANKTHTTIRIKLPHIFRKEKHGCIGQLSIPHHTSRLKHLLGRQGRGTDATLIFRNQRRVQILHRCMGAKFVLETSHLFAILQLPEVVAPHQDRAIADAQVDLILGGAYDPVGMRLNIKHQNTIRFTLSIRYGKKLMSEHRHRLTDLQRSLCKIIDLLLAQAGDSLRCPIIGKTYGQGATLSVGKGHDILRQVSRLHPRGLPIEKDILLPGHHILEVQRRLAGRCQGIHMLYYTLFFPCVKHYP